MGIAAQFETIIERQLNVHSAWLPITTPYKLGDYGLMSDGVFQKLGNIKEFDSISFGEDLGNEVSLNFVSDNTTVVNIDTGASVDLNKGGAIQANVKINFQNAQSFLVSAPIIKVRAISNVNQVAKQLKNADGWRNKFKVVSQVYEAQNPLIISTIEGGTEVVIGGEASALPQFNIGNASAKFSLQKNKELGLEISGKTGVIALGLFKLKTFGGGPVFLGEQDLIEDLKKQKLPDDI